MMRVQLKYVLFSLSIFFTCALSNTYASENHRTKAKKLVEQAIVLDQKQLNQKEILYKKAIDIDPTYARAYSNLGFILTRQRKFDSAILVLKNAIKYKTDNVYIYYYLGYALFSSRIYPESKVMLQRFVHNSTNDKVEEEYIHEARKIIVWLNENYGKTKLHEIENKKTSSASYDNSEERRPSFSTTPRKKLSIFFAYRIASLSDAGKLKLSKLTKILKEGYLSSVSIRIDGYADSKESDDKKYLQRISDLRGKAVESFLLDHGIAENRLDVEAFGSNGEKSHGKNSRVEFTNTTTKDPQPILENVQDY